MYDTLMKKGDNYMNKKLSLISLLFLSLSLLDYKYPYGFYMVLRFIVCCYFVYITHYLYKKSDFSYGLIFSGLFAFLYNPIVVVPLEKAMWYVLNIIAICFIIITYRSWKKTSLQSQNTSSAGYGKKNITLADISTVGIEFLSLPKNVQEKINNCNAVTLSVLNNNIRYIPDDVLSLQYTKDAIGAYSYHYASILYKMFNLSKKESNIAFSLLLLLLLTKGFCPSKKLFCLEYFDSNLITDKRFLFFCKAILPFITLKIEHQTGLLACIEKYIEDTTGECVRYMNKKDKQNG